MAIVANGSKLKAKGTGRDKMKRWEGLKTENILLSQSPEHFRSRLWIRITVAVAGRNFMYWNRNPALPSQQADDLSLQKRDDRYNCCLSWRDQDQSFM